MLDLKFVLGNTDIVREVLKKRGASADVYGELDKITPLAETRKKMIEESQVLKEKRNRVTDEIAKLKKNKEDASTLINEMKEVSTSIKQMDDVLRETEESIEAILLGIPNLVHPSVPEGLSEHDNVEIRKFGEIPSMGFTPKDHVTLGEDLEMLDFETAALISGARFTVYKKDLARLERSLINFMLDTHTENGYDETFPPFLVNSASMRGTGQLPKFAEDSFKVEGTDLWLIPTAEVPVTNYCRGKMLKGSDLPMKYAAYTACFRKEAGSYGKDMKGLIRVHQFNKVELVKYADPENSLNELEALLGDAEGILKKLNIPYRVVKLCSGDMSANAMICYDIEVWVPSQNKYREISSCSLFGDYQARRVNIRFRKDSKSKPEYVHTINGSGLAIGRTVVAIMENYQNEDGSITIPEALVPYMGGKKIICKS